MTIQTLGPGGIDGNTASDVKIDKFLRESVAILKGYRELMDQNLKIMSIYANKGGKEDLGLAMIGQQLKALNTQLSDAEKGDRQADAKFINMMDKRLSSTVKAIEDYAGAGVNPKFDEARKAQVNEKMAAARAAKQEKQAKEQTEAVEAQTLAIKEQTAVIQDNAKLAEDEAIARVKAEKQRILDSIKTRKEQVAKERAKAVKDRLTSALARSNKNAEGGKAHELTDTAIKTSTPGASSAIKVAMSAALGPASPIVNVLDKLIGFDKVTEKLLGKFNPFAKEKEASEEVSAIEKMKLRVVESIVGVRNTLEDGLSTLGDIARLGAKDAKLKAVEAKTQALALLDSLKGLKPKEQSGTSMLGNIFKGGMRFLGGWLSKIATLLGLSKAASMLGGLRGKGGAVLRKGKTILGKGKTAIGKGLGKGKALMGKASGFAGKVLGPVGAALGAYEVGSNFYNGPEAGARDRDGLSRGLDYGSGALSGAAAGALVGSVIPVVGTLVGSAVGAVVGTASVAWKEYGDVAITKAKSAAKILGNYVANTYESAKQVLGEYAETAKTLGADMLKAGKSKLADAGKTLTSNLLEFSSWLSNIGTTLKDGVKRGVDAVRQVPAAVATAAVKTAQEIGTVANKTYTAGVTKAKDIGTRIKVGGAALDRWNGGAKQDLKTAADVAGVDPGTLAKIAYFESRFDSNAKPVAGLGRAHLNKVKSFDGTMAMSSGHGYGQFIDDTWTQTLNKHGSKYGVKGAGTLSVSEANKYRENKSIQAGMLAEHTKENIAKGRALGGYSDDANAYAFHNLGSGDATTLLKALKVNPNMDVRSALLKGSTDERTKRRVESVITGNPSLYGNGKITVAEAYSRMQGHMAAGQYFADDIGGKAETVKPAASMATMVANSEGQQRFLKGSDNAVLDIPKHKGSLPMPAPKPPTAATPTSAPRMAASGNLLNIGNIPMFVNDWGILNVNTHGVLA